MGNREQRKPPVDRRLIVSRLERAQRERLYVQVCRWIPDCDQVEGFVVGIGRRWVAVAVVDDGRRFDGHAFVRLKDIQEVVVDPDPECIEIRALRARGLWPPPGIDAELDDAAGVMRAAIAAGSLTSIYIERLQLDIFWLGIPSFSGKRAIRLMEVNQKGAWVKRPMLFRLKDLTRVDFGDAYAESYRMIAGAPQ